MANHPSVYADYGPHRVKVTWVPSNTLPPAHLITSVHGFCFYQGQLVLGKLDRGYDLPGGHIEPGETPEECLRRETMEEVCVRGQSCTLLGYCIVDHRENLAWQREGKYPQVGYQPFYRMEVTALDPFISEFESSDRILVDPADIAQYWHGQSGLGRYVLAEALSVKRLYMARHAIAVGQGPEAPLTLAGQAQAILLADRLAPAGVERIVASPFRRAMATAEPVAARLGIPVEQDPRLAERMLSADGRADWLDRVRESFDDPDLCLPGGESNRTAKERGVAAIMDMLGHTATTTLLVSHGNLTTLLLQQFDPRIGFTDWQRMTNPDLYLVTLTATYTQCDRIWTD